MFNEQTQAEINAFEQQLHALSTNLYTQYARPSSHQIGIAMKQMCLLAHDIEYMCGQEARAYDMAMASEKTEVVPSVNV